MTTATILASGCGPEADEPDGNEGLLLTAVETGPLDPSRIRVGLFELNGTGRYATAMGQQTDFVRLHVLPEDSGGVHAWAYDDDGVVDEAEVDWITVRPLVALDHEDVETFDDIEFELVSPVGPPPEFPDYEAEQEPEPATAVVVPLVWYDADGDQALDFDFGGESETVRALTYADGERELTLTHIEVEYIFRGHTPEAGARIYEIQWTVWALDSENEPFVVLDWSTPWTAELESPTESRGTESSADR